MSLLEMQEEHNWELGDVERLEDGTLRRWDICLKCGLERIVIEKFARDGKPLTAEEAENRVC